MLDDEFNQINAVLNVQDNNLSTRSRLDMAGTSQDDRGDETKYLVSVENFQIHQLIWLIGITL